MINWVDLKQSLVWLSYSSHMGDVNNSIPVLLKDLGLPEAEWSDDQERWVMAWEEPDE